MLAKLQLVEGGGRVEGSPGRGGGGGGMFSSVNPGCVEKESMSKALNQTAKHTTPHPMFVRRQLDGVQHRVKESISCLNRHVRYLESNKLGRAP